MAVQPKTPIMELFELCVKNRWQKPEFGNCRQEGASHQPTFYVTETVNGIEARGQDSSKQGAKQKCAQILLDKLKGRTVACVPTPLPNLPVAQSDNRNLEAKQVVSGEAVVFNRNDPIKSLESLLSFLNLRLMWLEKSVPLGDDGRRIWYEAIKVVSANGDVLQSNSGVDISQEVALVRACEPLFEVYAQEALRVRRTILPDATCTRESPPLPKLPPVRFHYRKLLKEIQKKQTCENETRRLLQSRLQITVDDESKEDARNLLRELGTRLRFTASFSPFLSNNGEPLVLPQNNDKDRTAVVVFLRLCTLDFHDIERPKIMFHGKSEVSADEAQVQAAENALVYLLNMENKIKNGF